MTMPIEQIIKSVKYQQFEIAPNDLAVIFLTVLYHNKRITKTRYKYYISKYDMGIHDKKVDQYYSHITGSWYCNQYVY
jgi:hypothetical protein